MLLSTLLVSAALCVASQASELHQSHHSSNLNSLFARQSTVSDACEATVCASFRDTLTSCKTMSCLCNSSVAASLQSCIDCAVKTDPSARTIEAVHQLADAYEDSCIGYNIPAIRVDDGTGAASSTAAAVTGGAASGTNKGSSTATSLPSGGTDNLIAGTASTTAPTSPTDGVNAPSITGMSGSSTTTTLSKSVAVALAGVGVGMALFL